jgi:hypothetical protein
MKDERVFSEHDLPFTKRPRKQPPPTCNRDSLGRRALKTFAGAALTGDPTGAVVGAVADTVVDKLWRKR